MKKFLSLALVLIGLSAMSFTTVDKEIDEPSFTIEKISEYEKDGKTFHDVVVKDDLGNIVEFKTVKVFVFNEDWCSSWYQIDPQDPNSKWEQYCLDNWGHVTCVKHKDCAYCPESPCMGE